MIMHVRVRVCVCLGRGVFHNLHIVHVQPVADFITNLSDSSYSYKHFLIRCQNHTIITHLPPDAAGL